MSETNPSEIITIIANGQPRAIDAGSTVADLLHVCNIEPKYVVVQLEGDIVPRADIAHVILRDGNKLEIVTLVGGG